MRLLPLLAILALAWLPSPAHAVCPTCTFSGGTGTTTTDTTTTSSSASTGGSILDPGSSCKLCTPIDSLYTLSEQFSRGIFAALAPLCISIAKLMMLLGIMGGCFRLITKPDETGTFWVSFVTQSIWNVAILAMLGASKITVPYSGGAQGGSDYAVFAYVIELLQVTATNLGAFVINTASKLAGGVGISASAPGANSPYGVVWYNCEQTVLQLVAACWNQLVNHASIWELDSLLGWLLLLVPYLFVLGIFMAFLVQSMFYFTSIGALSPVLIMALSLEKTRGFAWSGLRILLTGALTVVFAATAMAFSGFIIAKFLPPLTAMINGGSDPVIFLSVNYWAMLLMGFVSILLHLQAPKLAANIGGAQDSAASAAAVTGAGMFLGGKGLGAIKQAGIGDPAKSGQYGGFVGGLLGQGGGAGLLGGAGGLAGHVLGAPLRMAFRKAIGRGQ